MNRKLKFCETHVYDLDLFYNHYNHLKYYICNSKLIINTIIIINTVLSARQPLE